MEFFCLQGVGGDIAFGVAGGEFPVTCAVFFAAGVQKNCVTVFRFPMAFAYSLVKERPGQRAAGHALG
jgi:hypothetical protein